MARRFGATKVVLFGGALRDPENARDVDLACDIRSWNIFPLGGELEHALGVPVDVVPLDPPSRFTDHILRRGRILYDAA
jgi:uncharacterized protein